MKAKKSIFYKKDHYSIPKPKKSNFLPQEKLSKMPRNNNLDVFKENKKRLTSDLKEFKSGSNKYAIREYFPILINNDNKIKYYRGNFPIKKFESFSKKFVSIIALDKKSGEDSFKEVYDIIQEAKFLFHLDSEDLKYEINGEDKKIPNVDELTKFGNKINIQYQNKKEEKKEKDIFELKCDKLLFFKDLVSKIEIIYDKINILGSKGYNIAIEIKIEIKYPNVTYELYGKPKDFNYIKDQKGHCEISEIIRYILNKTKVNKE